MEGSQDIRDLVLHIAADAPPPSWVKVEVLSLSIFHPVSLIANCA